MATVTWNVNKDARIADQGGTSLGAGASDFNPVGPYSGFLYRTLLGFSYSFSGMVEITSAILWMKSSTQSYVGFGSSPSVQARRLSSSWSEGTSVSMSGSNAVEWSNQPGVTGSESAATAMTETELTWDTVNITTIIQEAFAANSFYGLRIYASDEGNSTDVWEMCSREYSTSSDPYIVVTYSTNTAPTAPTSLSPTGDTVIQNLTPTFTATFNDPDAGEVMANYQINVYEDNGTTLKWDSGAIAGSTINRTYNGPALTGNTFYKWTVRAQDDGGLWGPYQPTLSRFKVNSVPNAPVLSLVQSPTNDITTLTPTFNITHSDPDASDSLMSAYRLYVWNSAWGGIWDTGYVAVTATATKQVTYAGPALAWNSTYYWSAYTYDSNGATYGNWGSTPAFTTHKTGVPISLDPTGGETCPLSGTGKPQPTFTGARATTNDLITSVTIKLFASSDLVTPVWTYGPTATGTSSTGFSVAYPDAASTLAYGASYQWQAQVVSSIGGTSDWSALQTFVTPASGSISMTAPVSPVTDTTPDFTFGRTVAFNAWNIVVYDSTGGGTPKWDSGTQTMTSGTTKTATYGVGGTVNLATLVFGTQYKWKVRVSADSGSTWGAGFSGLVAFTMDSAGVPTLNRPASSAWLGTPAVVDSFDNITSITNGANLTATAEGTIFVTGRGSVKYTGTFSGTQMAYRTFGTALDLSSYGALTPIKVRSYISSLTSVTYVRIRFASTGGPSTNYAEYTVTPTGTGAWEQKTVTKGSPSATAGTINWADIKYIGVVASYAASVGPTIYIDDLLLDAIAPAFEGTTASSEVISTYRIRVYGSDQTTLVWDSGDTAGSGTTFSKLYAGTALTAGNTYYWQASYVKSSGAPGGYSSKYPFTLNSAPIVPAALVPVSGSILADSLVPVFSSTFNDNEKTSRADYPTMYEVEVIRNSDSVLVYSLLKDSGLNAGTNSVYDGEAGVLKVTGAANPIAYETEYAYRVRYRDSMGAVGSWSSYVVFKPSQSPTVTISAPASGSTATSPAVNVSWAQSSPGGKAQNSYRLLVWNADLSTVTYDSDRVYTSSASYSYPAGTLVNNTDYEFRVMTWDTDGLPSAWDVNTLTTNWSGPAAVADFIALADETYSAVRLSWAQSQLAGNAFRKYTIYRKKVTDFTWSILTEIPSISTLSYNDYMAAYDVAYEYKITQWSIVVGDADLQSGDSDLSTESLEADSWYVIGWDRNPDHIFELPVIAGPFAEPVQQEVFEPLGTSRKVIIRGKVMGAEGTLGCKWDASQRQTAIEQIDYIKSNAGPHILKSPFGDIWQVEFNGPTKDYEMGGHITINLTWTEVA
jgi:hypothetical protein